HLDGIDDNAVRTHERHTGRWRSSYVRIAEPYYMLADLAPADGPGQVALRAWPGLAARHTILEVIGCLLANRCPLRPRRERPIGCRTAEHRYELAAPHGGPSSEHHRRDGEAECLGDLKVAAYTASFEDIRRFQLHLAASGAGRLCASALGSDRINAARR